MKTTIAKWEHRARAIRPSAVASPARAAPAHPASILVPVDFSDCSRKAIAYALPLARKFGATLTLLHVVHVNYCYAGAEYSALDYPALMEDSRLHSVKQLARLAGALRRDCSIKTAIESGHPGDVIVSTAEKLGADLIVISTHGRTGLKRALLGSTAEYVVRHAPCPVLVVREHERNSSSLLPLGMKGNL